MAGDTTTKTRTYTTWQQGVVGYPDPNTRACRVPGSKYPCMSGTRVLIPVHVGYPRPNTHACRAPGS